MEIFVILSVFSRRKTKPILWKGKSKKAKGKNESNSGDSPGGYLKKQSQFAGGGNELNYLYERGL